VVSAALVHLDIGPATAWLGSLPGDIVIERDNFGLYFRLATCILISAVVSGIVWLLCHLPR
jgi:hypothetical protein